jgi:23S rRNA-/tRNA-specific pseudouridylate synthase
LNEPEDLAAIRGRAQKEPLIALRQAYALIEAKPETGRTHQIRAHLAALGYPVAADALYGGGEGIFLPHVQGEDAALLGRVGLHACSLELAHPKTAEKMLFEAPYPGDLDRTLLLLRKYCSENPTSQYR